MVSPSHLEELYAACACPRNLVVPAAWARRGTAATSTNTSTSEGGKGGAGEGREVKEVKEVKEEGIAKARRAFFQERTRMGVKALRQAAQQRQDQQNQQDQHRRRRRQGQDKDKDRDRAAASGVPYRRVSDGPPRGAWGSRRARARPATAPA